jgi:hypothetical protein
MDPVTALLERSTGPLDAAAGHADHVYSVAECGMAVHRLRRAADSEHRWHRARGEPLRDWEGRIIHVC